MLKTKAALKIPSAILNGVEMFFFLSFLWALFMGVQDLQFLWCGAAKIVEDRRRWL